MHLELQNPKGTSVPIARVTLTTAHLNLTAFLKEETQWQPSFTEEKMKVTRPGHTAYNQRHKHTYEWP